ncbi:hypothetical protein [Paraclostridium dentum]|uniref:hypothetical protein n=1 Tax=Paraclostridium dentum TaxID=2662455 RepID=UPI003F30B535
MFGQAVSIGLLHGGVSPQFFSNRLFNMISGEDPDPVSVSEICDKLQQASIGYDLKNKLRNIILSVVF